MRILVLGAGITGITAAYYLSKAGHEVSVIDRQKGAAQECSFANGGQLSYSHAEPWATPSIVPNLPKWLFSNDAPLVMKWSADPQMLRWGVSFLKNCLPHISRKNHETMMRIGMYSREKMREIRNDTGINFHWHDKGILHVFSEAKAYAQAQKVAAFQETLGCHEDVISTEQCLEMEPSLHEATYPILGGIHAPLDESGHIHMFTQKLAQYITTRYHAQFFYDTEVQSINREGNQIASVNTSRGEMQADAYVLATGANSPLLSKSLGFRLPIYPMKGYSLTVPACDQCPQGSITDAERRIVYSRLGDDLRIAGTAEFAGYDTEINPVRVEAIKSAVRKTFPHMRLEEASEWACLRPSTPDGPPIVGKSPLNNLYLHTGHGTLGWTQSAGSAALLADVIDNRIPEISLQGLSLRRYQRV